MRFSQMSFVAGAVVLASAGVSQAIQIVEWQPSPITVNQPEFLSEGGVFATTVSTLSANAANPTAPTLPGGILIETPYTFAAAINGKVQTAIPTTLFYDTSLTLSANLVGPAVVSPDVVGVEVSRDSLVACSRFGASNATPSAGTLLLSGTFGLTRLAGTLGGSTASVTSNNVTYTGGAITTPWYHRTPARWAR